METGGHCQGLIALPEGVEMKVLSPGHYILNDYETAKEVAKREPGAKVYYFP